MDFHRIGVGDGHSFLAIVDPTDVQIVREMKPVTRRLAISLSIWARIASSFICVSTA